MTQKEQNYWHVTPLCDKVQNKHRKIRAIKGIIIEEKFAENLDKKTEALFVSPPFFLENDEKSFVLVLNFRYFFTYPTDQKLLDTLMHINPIFRLRSTIISEIQSKLARHVNRQGILYVE
ncbi:MAG TPA: hypothetical protein VLZ33_05830 [Dysgonamonadaceae bacterium]|nr:hypothetical protein [Dysgonamonadaceae bacterium]